MNDTAIAFAAKLAEHNLTVSSVFVPWSRSRNVKSNPKISDRSLNWRVTLRKGEQVIIEGDYSAGIGHCPSYTHGHISVDDARAIEYETEHGKKGKPGFAIRVVNGQPIYPKTADVVSSFLMDGEAIDYPTYEDWAGDCGYDQDSRKGETVYRACRTIGLKLRALLGDTLLGELRELSRGL